MSVSKQCGAAQRQQCLRWFRSRGGLAAHVQTRRLSAIVQNCALDLLPLQGFHNHLMVAIQQDRTGVWVCVYLLILEIMLKTNITAKQTILYSVQICSFVQKKLVLSKLHCTTVEPPIAR